MALDFRRRRVTIPYGTGRRIINDSVTFGSSVNRADIALNGFQLDYVNSDHHINVVEIDTDITGRSHNTVNFRIEANYADKNFDDIYHGYVEVLVIADVG